MLVFSIILDLLILLIICVYVNITIKNKELLISLSKARSSKITLICSIFAQIFILTLFIRAIKSSSIPLWENFYTYFLIFSIECIILSLLMIKRKVGITKKGILDYNRFYSWHKIKNYEFIIETNELSLTLKNMPFGNLNFRTSTKDTVEINNLLKKNLNTLS